MPGAQGLTASGRWNRAGADCRTNQRFQEHNMQHMPKGWSSRPRRPHTGEEQMNIRIQTRVKELIEKEIVTGGKKDENDKAILSYRKVGWFVHFEGSYEALYVGDEKPGSFWRKDLPDRL